jgi:predicted TIM-barrel fold metal-dependent hydrolase
MFITILSRRRLPVRCLGVISPTPIKADIKIILGNGFGMAGMEAPSWNLKDDLTFSKQIGVKTAIFSVSTPGVAHISNPDESARVAREMNEYCASLRDQDPSSYGFFATVPSLEHTDLVLQELLYAFDTLHADGVTLFTRYPRGSSSGDGYLGHPAYIPVWEVLDARKAVVFIHPCNNKNATLFNDKLPMPAFDWPHETGRTAMDLILNRRLQQFSNTKIILSHAGGTLPLLARRSNIIATPEFGAAMSAADILDQAKSFYFDTALSGSPEILPLILKFAKVGHVLFGSDYPHAPPSVSSGYTRFFDEYEVNEETRREMCYGAAEKLFPRLNGLYKA